MTEIATAETQFFKNCIKNFIKMRIDSPIIKMDIQHIWIENTNYLVIIESNGKNSLIDITADIDEIYLNIFIQSMVNITTKYNIQYELFIMAMFNYHLNQASNNLFSIDDKSLFEKCIFDQKLLPKYENAELTDEIIECFYNQIDNIHKEAKSYLFYKYLLENMFQTQCSGLFNSFLQDLDRAFG
jgi:hypothetical protein